MALIASLTFNVVVGSIFGTPGVLLQPMERHLGVSTEMASAGLLGVIVSSAFFAPQIGALAARVPMRWIVALASLLLSAAWMILAFTQSYALYVAVYALLLGPVMAIGASVVPPTLVTRWFNRNRGLAIGLVHLTIVVAAMPLACEWLISRFGLQNTLVALSLLPLFTLLPASLLIIDWPPGQEPMPAASASRDARGGQSLTILGLLKRPKFWALSLAVGVPNTSSTLLGLHLVSMAKSWGVAPLAAAGLASIMSAGGIAGSVMFGILADRIGGARALVVIALASAALWLLFVAGLSYGGLAVAVGLIGMCGAGTVPAFSKALGDAFGRESFSRAIGLMVPITLPILFAGLIGPGTVVRIYGSYTPVVLAMTATLGLAGMLAFLASRTSLAAQSPAVAQ